LCSTLNHRLCRCDFRISSPGESPNGEQIYLPDFAMGKEERTAELIARGEKELVEARGLKPLGHRAVKVRVLSRAASAHSPTTEDGTCADRSFPAYVQRGDAQGGGADGAEKAEVVPHHLHSMEQLQDVAGDGDPLYRCGDHAVFDEEAGGPH
jgi:hypothetical protein